MKKNLNKKLVDESKVNIAIVGGGATGVELTAELYHATEDLSSYGYGKIDNSCLQVTLVEAGPRLLPALPENLSAAVLDELQEMGGKREIQYDDHRSPTKYTYHQRWRRNQS